MVDRYTKVVLTVIAGCLLALVIQNAISPSQAKYGEVQKVQVCDGLGEQCGGMQKVQVCDRDGRDCATVESVLESDPLGTKYGGNGFRTSWGIRVVPPATSK